MNIIEEKKILESIILKIDEAIEITKLRLKAVPNIYANNMVMLNNMKKQYTDRLIKLEKSMDKPYFAMIDFCESSKDMSTKYYIGKNGVIDDDNKIIVVDWRAPISTIYYDSNVGEVSYTSPSGVVSGDLLMKKQYNIENRELLSVIDVDTVSNDELLKPFLGTDSETRLKNIVSTIQAEQNSIIRETLFKNTVVQGVAGSGKTTVALHRIAYLVYNNLDKINPDQYFVLGPNKFFVNYISSVLPDLDVNDVKQLTYDQLVAEVIGKDFVLTSSTAKLNNYSSVDKLRCSLDFKDYLDNFCELFIKSILPKADFTINGYEILRADEIKKVFDSEMSEVSGKFSFLKAKVDKIMLILSNKIENNIEEIKSSVYESFSNKVDDMSPEMLKKERIKYNNLEKELRNGCKQSLRKHFKKVDANIYNLYVDFVKFIIANEKDDAISKKFKEVLVNLKNNVVEFEDLASLLYLNFRVYGSGDFNRIKYSIIDEAQDFGTLNYFVLKQFLQNSYFGIYGDLSQSIYQYRSIDSWDEVISTCFDGKCSISYLQKSYRTTAEIMHNANLISSHIGMVLAEPVLRHGDDVKYVSTLDSLDLNLLEFVNNSINKKYKTSAIICKSDVEANNIYNLLKNNNIDVSLISDEDAKFSNGIFVVTSYLAKGLEFDSVLIPNVDEEVYDSNDVNDMKLLYVAMTRSLHELTVGYEKCPTKPLANRVDDRFLMKIL